MTFPVVPKVRQSYDPSCKMCSSFNFMVIFSMSADVMLKMTIKLKELKIGQLES